MYAFQKGLDIIKKNRENKLKIIHKSAKNLVLNLDLNQSMNKLIAALLYWGEGSKTDGTLTFTNSDPVLIITFLTSLRKGFLIDERKLRCLVHIHEYHDESEVLDYWSKITHIPLSQFTKSYLKKNRGKNIKDEYKGTIRIRYYDTKVVHELKAIYNTLANHLGA